MLAIRIKRLRLSGEAIGTAIVVLALAVPAICARSAAAQTRDVDPRIVFEEQRPLSYDSIRMPHLGRGPVDRLMTPVSKLLIELKDARGSAFITYYTQMFQQGNQAGPTTGPSTMNWTPTHSGSCRSRR